MGGRGRLVVFVGLNPKSQLNIKKLNLLIDRMRRYYDVTLVQVPDDSTDGLPYLRVEFEDSKSSNLVRELGLDSGEV